MIAEVVDSQEIIFGSVFFFSAPSLGEGCGEHVVASGSVDRRLVSCGGTCVFVSTYVYLKASPLFSFFCSSILL
jgi:hypothetical protein